MRVLRHGAAAALLLAGLATGLSAQAPDRSPKTSTVALEGDPFADVGIDQNLGAQLPLETVLRNEAGADVQLGDYFGERPVLLVFVYYECPMLCNLVLEGLLRTARTINFDAGDEYSIVAVGIDPGETPELAAKKRDSFVRAYDRPGTTQGWNFLTGDEASIAAVTSAAGFRFVYLPDKDEYAHDSALLVATPEGRLSRYFYGIEYSPRDVRLGLIESSNEKIGSLADRFVTLCYGYDPTTGKYGLIVMNLIRFFGAITLLCLGGFVTLYLRRDRLQQAALS